MISVIVPVYNVEKYLKQCVDSVLNQTYLDYEIILVDDGSKDNSGMLCDEYQKLSNKIKVIHKENGGLSSARNCGIRHASGEYLMFLDSDDYWDNNHALEKVVSSLDDCDFLNFHYKKYFEDTKKYQHVFGNIDISLFNQLDIVEKKNLLIQSNQYITSACNKVVSKNFIDKYELYFSEGITSEDIDWCARLFLLSNFVEASNDDFYVYRQREQSITHTVKLKNLIDLSNNIIRSLSYMNQYTYNKQIEHSYLSYMAYQYGIFLVCYHLVEDENKKEILNKMKDYSYLLQYGLSKKVKLLYIVKKLFGFNFMMLLLKLYSLVRK